MSATPPPRPLSASAQARAKRLSSMSPSPNNNGVSAASGSTGSPSSTSSRTAKKSQVSGGGIAGKLGRTTSGVSGTSNGMAASGSGTTALNLKPGRPGINRPSSNGSNPTTPSRTVSSSDRAPACLEPSEYVPQSRDSGELVLTATEEGFVEMNETESGLEAAFASGDGGGEDGVLGGLMERSPEELNKAGVEELRIALRREWDEREELNQTLLQFQSSSPASSSNPSSSSTQRDLHRTRTSLAQVLEDQDRLQLELQDKTRACEEFEGVLRGWDLEREGLAVRVGELERKLEDAKLGSYAIEKDLRLQLDMERRRAQAALPNPGDDPAAGDELSPDTPTAATQSISQVEPETVPLARHRALSADLDSVNAEMSNLQATLATVQATLGVTQSEREEFKQLHHRAQEENEAFEAMLRERTLQGRMSFGGGSGLDAGSTISGIPSAGSASSEMSRSSSGGLGGVRSGYGQSMPSVGRGMGKSLAEELMGSEDVADGAEGGMSRSELEAKVKFLEGDNKDLQRANAGLKAYCSRTLNRIAEEGGLEHVLNADYDTARRPTLGHASSSTEAISTLSGPSSSRPSFAIPRVISPSGTPSGVGSSGLLGVPQVARARLVDPKTGLRPLSMVINQEVMQAQAAAAKENLPSAIASQAEKRARRGLSMNLSALFGSFPVNGSASALAPKPPSPMRASSFPEEDSIMAPSVPMPKADSPRARKLECHPEDEEDRVERERLAATMKLMGVVQAEPEDMATPRMSASAQGSPSPLQTPTFPVLSRSSSGPLSPPLPGPPKRSNSALNRLSSIFGKAPALATPLSPEVEKLDPNAHVTDEMAAEMLKAFDKREQQMMLSKGYSGLTSPAEGGVRAMAERRRKSGSTGSNQLPSGSVIVEETPERTQELDAEGINAAWTASSQKGKSSITTLFEVEDPHS